MTINLTIHSLNPPYLRSPNVVVDIGMKIKEKKLQSIANYSSQTSSISVTRELVKMQNLRLHLKVTRLKSIFKKSHVSCTHVKA